MKVTKELLDLYYKMQGKIILPKQNIEEYNISLATTVAANFASIGFPMTTGQIIDLAGASKENIIEFYKTYKDILSENIGAGKQPKPFYPDFPEGCMERSDAEYFIDQIIYGLSGLQIEPSQYIKEKKIFPFIGEPMRHILMAGDKNDFVKTFEMAVGSEIAYSKIQKDFIKAYIEANPEYINNLIEKASAQNRENAISCAMMLEEITGSSKYTEKFIKQPVDLLRYAAFKSIVKENEKKDVKRDPYAAIALRDTSKTSLDNRGVTVEATMPRFALSRKERTFIMNCLAKMDKNDAKELSKMFSGHKEEWKRLFKNLHISDKAWNAHKYDNVKEAIAIIQGGIKFDRPERRIEEAIKSGDLQTALNELKNRPGEFMRRFDKLYRMAIENGKDSVSDVLHALAAASTKVGIATVTSVIGNISKRDHDEEQRYFKDKNGKVTVTSEKNRKGFSEAQIKAVDDIAMQGLTNRFKGKESMGKVYIMESIEDISIPTDVRESNGGIGTLTTGSKMPFSDKWEKMRFFITWTNVNSKKNDYDAIVDIDLSVAMCNKNMHVVNICGWDTSYCDKDNSYIFSGDVQNGGPANEKGRAEYIDVDLSKLKEKGIRYIIPQVNSFTGQEFNEQPHTAFGVMRCSDDDMGDVFEPSTVINKFALESEATCASPYIIDIENREILWMNEKSQQTVASLGLNYMLKQIERASESKFMPLDKLIEANVRANGQFTENPKDADIIFVRDATEAEEVMDKFGIDDIDRFILSTDMEYITGYLLKDGVEVPTRDQEREYFPNNSRDDDDFER